MIKGIAGQTRRKRSKRERRSEVRRKSKDGEGIREETLKLVGNHIVVLLIIVYGDEVGST